MMRGPLTGLAGSWLYGLSILRGIEYSTRLSNKNNRQTLCRIGISRPLKPRRNNHGCVDPRHACTKTVITSNQYITFFHLLYRLSRTSRTWRSKWRSSSFGFKRKSNIWMLSKMNITDPVNIISFVRLFGWRDALPLSRWYAFSVPITAWASPADSKKTSTSLVPELVEW